MNIKEFSHNLKNLYQEMSSTFSHYQASQNLNCVLSCGGKCCQNPEIEASIYEMLPMALKIYEEGSLEDWIVKNETAEQNFCLVYDQASGKCGRYEDRPSICRMFGVAGYRNKREEITLSICKYIKEAYNISEVPVGLSPAETPLMKNWFSKLAALDPKLTQDRLPINQALYHALMKVALCAQYQE